MKHFHYDSLISTNEQAKLLLNEHDSIIITADEQLGGKGRKNRTWVGDKGKNLYCSIGFKHKIHSKTLEPHSYQFAGAIIAYNTITRIIPKEQVRLKFPNDIMVRNDDGVYRKICGILTEHTYYGNTLQATIIGIGINVEQSEFPDEIKDIATSLNSLGYVVSAHDIFNFLFDIVSEYKFDNDAAIYDEWHDLVGIEGRIVKLVSDGQNYLVTKVFDDGRLKAENITDSSIKIIDDGDSIRYDYE
jgi:BirA family biotin operon repressor/biotin-[acetyl-CoA-carboxylase] ligase